MTEEEMVQVIRDNPDVFRQIRGHSTVIPPFEERVGNQLGRIEDKLDVVIQFIDKIKSLRESWDD